MRKRKNTFKKAIAVLTMATMLLSSPNISALASSSLATPNDVTETSEDVSEEENKGKIGSLINGKPSLNGTAALDGSNVTAKANGKNWTEGVTSITGTEKASISGNRRNIDASVHNMYEIVDKDGKRTVAYCMQPFVLGPDENGMTYTEGHKWVEQLWGAEEGNNKINAMLGAAKFIHGGTNADPNVGTWKGDATERNLDDGGTFGTYLIGATDSNSDGVYEDLKAVRGLMIAGKVYEMTDEEARALSSVVVHSIIADSQVTQIIGKSGRDLTPAYNHLMGIANGTYDKVKEYGDDIRVDMDTKDYYSCDQKFTWEIFNPSSNTWEAYTSTDSLDRKYVSSANEIKLRVKYTSYGLCNNLTQTTSSGNMTVKHNFTAFNVGSSNALFNYFDVVEGNGNNVPFTVTYDKITAGYTKEKDYWFRGTTEYKRNTFNQTATITVDATKFNNASSKLAIGVTMETGATNAPTKTTENGKTVYSAKMYQNIDRQDMLFLASNKSVSTSSNVTLDLVNTASLKLEKRSKRPDLTTGSPCYDLGDAEYEVKDSTGTIVGKFKTRVTTDTEVAIGIVTEAKYNKADVGTDTLTNLPFDRYTIKETKEPMGYELDTTTYNPILSADYATKPYVFKHEDMPGNDPLTLDIIKADYESLSDAGKEKADLTLEGTQFTVKYYNVQYDDINQIPANAVPTKTWVLGVKKTTDNEKTVFRAEFKDEYKISGDDFYLSDLGSPVIPYGCITVEETNATLGYDESEVEVYDEKNNTITGGVYFKKIAEGESVPSADWNITYNNIPNRTSASLTKVDYENKEPLANIPFSLERVDENGTVLEKHIIVTDENGKWNSETIANSNNTNGNDAAYDTENYNNLKPTGIWFYGTKPEDSKITDDKGALLYGTYILKELPCENNKDRQLIDDIKVTVDSTDEVDFGVIDNVPKPSISTLERDSETNSHYTVADNGVKLVDTVTYKYLTAGEKYTLWGVIIDKKTEKPLLDKSGKVITATKSFTVDSTYQVSRFEKTGKTDVTFEFDGTGMDGKSFVIFEYLYEGENASGDFLNGKELAATNSSKASHTSLTDANQIGYFPSMSTKAFDVDTNSNTLSLNDVVNIADIVTLNNMMVGEKYVLNATLINKTTGEVLKNENGEIITGTFGFTATKANDTKEVKFPAIKRELIASHKSDIVIFEELIWQKSATENIVYTKHTDINDLAQTLHVVDLETTATSDGEKVAPIGKEVTIDDKVSYTGLIIGKKYTIDGVLMVKSTGKALTDKNGNEITATKTFTATKEDGYEILSFTFDSSLLQGEKVVVFESLKQDDIEVAVHKDLNDDDQTVEFPKMSTSIICEDTNERVAYLGSDVTLIDTITYENFIVGKEYKMVGVLMNRETGLPLMDNKTMKFITSEATFIPTKEDGTYEMKFVFNAYNAGIINEDGSIDDVVCFEKAYYDKVNDKGEAEEAVWAYHEDIEDEFQTVEFVFPSITTSLLDSYTGKPVAYLNEKVTLVDTISYTNFTPNREYKIVGTLMNKDTGKALVDTKTGKNVTTEVIFTPTKENGTVNVTFVFDAYNVGIIKDDNTVSDIVCFEKVYINNDASSSEEILYCSHEDINAISQTVKIPSGRTSAKDGVNGTHTGTPSEKATIIDTVYYTNLIPGKTYTLKGKLWTKDENGNPTPFLDNGKEVVAEIKFTPTEPSSSIDMVFTFNASSLKGKTITVFEDCYDGDRLAFTHSDIEDDEQTISYPSITTEIKTKGGSKTLEPEHKYTLIDTITYEDFVVGEEYVIEGVLMERVETRDANGNILSVTEKEYVDKNGKKSTAKVEFVPTKVNGKVDVTFEFYTSEDTYNKTFVCFERIYTKDTHTEICSHTDINDSKQSFTVNDMVKTGDLPIGIVCCFMAFALLGIVLLLMNRKKEIKEIPLIKL